MTEPIPTVLDDDQRRRAAALRIAAEVYDHHLPRGGLLTPGPLSPRQKSSHRCWALTHLATYVLDGAEAVVAEDEWAPGEEEGADAKVILPDGWALHDGPEAVTGEAPPSETPCRDPWCTEEHYLDTPCRIPETPLPANPTTEEKSDD